MDGIKPAECYAKSVPKKINIKKMLSGLPVRVIQNKIKRGTIKGFNVLIFKKYPHSGMIFINIGTAFGLQKLS